MSKVETQKKGKERKKMYINTCVWLFGIVFCYICRVSALEYIYRIVFPDVYEGTYVW